ncbi:hypothetical protein D9M68_758520 [compost metagenome]
MSVGIERLGAIDHVAVAVQPRAGLDALQVRAGTGFGHADGCDDIAASHAGQPAALLLLAAIVMQVLCNDVVRTEAGAEAAFRADFHQRGKVGVVAIAAAMLRRQVRQQETHLAQAIPDDAVGMTLFFPGLQVGQQFACPVAACSLLELFDFMGTPG